ncbi:alpha/beta hydrolase [Pilimelia columellifera]|uniref:Alpha/beta hydrolase n=1 Tax=Pilimelia columellifera subsp. columellifera TaxID=706583 RepID=A0ABP6B1G5_9ACTN
MEPDLLGPPYESQTLDLGHDDEGPVVATLVRRRAEAPTRRAVLYVHGFIDYFFQTHLADFFVDRGWDFYAVDLRKYGRSLLPHQTPNFCRDVRDYYPDLDAAVQVVREQDGHDEILLLGHSTGGLVGALWAHDRREARLIDGLLLNSPFLDFNAAWVLRRPLLALVAGLGRRAPYRRFPMGVRELYGQSLHHEHRGEWSYDLRWKPLAGFPIHTGWLAAIRDGHRRVRAGLAIDVPVLVACGARSFYGRRWREAARHADAVLNVEHIARWAPRLGPRVSVVRIDGGVHDLTLSTPSVRATVFGAFDHWLRAQLPSGPKRPTD